MGTFGIGENGGKPSNLSKFDGDLGSVERIAKQIYLDKEEAAERKEVEVTNKNKLNELEPEVWKASQSKPLRVKNVKGKIIDNSVTKQDRQPKSFDTVII